LSSKLLCCKNIPISDLGTTKNMSATGSVQECLDLAANECTLLNEPTIIQRPTMFECFLEFITVHGLVVAHKLPTIHDFFNDFLALFSTNFTFLVHTVDLVSKRFYFTRFIPYILDDITITSLWWSILEFCGLPVSLSRSCIVLKRQKILTISFAYDSHMSLSNSIKNLAYIDQLFPPQILPISDPPP